MAIRDWVAKLPSPILGPAFVFIYGLALLWLWLAGSLSGLLAVAVAVYWLCGSTGLVEPMTAAQLAMWFDDLSVEAKSALLTAAITAIGFVVTFRLAIVATQKQLLVQRRLDIAEKLDDFFDEAVDLANQLSFYAEQLLDLHQRIMSSPNTAETERWARIAVEKGADFRVARQRLVAMGAEVYKFGGRYALVFAGVIRASKLMKRLEESLGAVTKAAWFPHPQCAPDDSGLVAICRHVIDPAACQKYIDTMRVDGGRIGGLVGGLRSVLQFPIIGAPGLRMFGLVAKARSSLKEMLSDGAL